MVELLACAQFRRACLRQITACVGHALAKTAVMRFLAESSLPFPPPPCSSIITELCVCVCVCVCASFSEGDMQWTRFNVRLYPFLPFLAGITAGSLGE